MGRAALIMVLGISVSFSTIKFNLRTQALRDVEACVQQFERIVARNAANCAASIARLELIGDNSWRPASQVTSDDPTFAPIIAMMDSGGTYALGYEDNSMDTTLAEDLVRVTATATFGAGDHEVQIVMRRRYVMPPVPAAVFIDAPATFGFHGNAFEIDGRDTRIGGGAGAGASVPGIGVVDTTSLADALGALEPNQRTNIRGQGGFPSIDTLSVDFDFTDIVDRLDQYADRRLPDGTTAGGILEWGTTENPEITVAEGDIHLTGGGHGAGVLLIKGSLFMTGNFEWHGPVIVIGDDVTISVDARGNPDIYGALMIQANTVHFDVRGNIGMHYSTEALQGNEGRLNLHDYSVVSWWE